ncbi:CHAP domain-containing protein [Novosphingobium bradum]|uniref:CHAP domain-containing protein n=1 Tax=Novosphingobium bradum TaxID=1737444 RepID=A0ABV7IMK9_9SPHN
MRWKSAPLLALALAALTAPALADTVVDTDHLLGGGSASLPPYLQCVPYARAVSGVNLFGDARTWWDQAEGRYARGYRPRVGAVMTFKPYGAMALGHVAAVSRIIDSRTVLLRHANWSPINGRRGQIENDVAAVDVSPGNDWSEVRVWFAPLQDLGTTHWPVQGFIYPNKAGKAQPATSLATVGVGVGVGGGVGADPIGAIIAARLRLR